MDLLAVADSMLSLSRRLAGAGAAGVATPKLVSDAKLQMGAASLLLSEVKHGSHASEQVLTAAELLNTSPTRMNGAIRALNDGATFLQTRAMYRGAFD